MAQIEGHVKINVNANQATKQLEKLDNKASELRREIIKISKQKFVDPKQVKLLEKELKGVEKQQVKLRKSAVNYRTVLNNLSGASLQDLRKASRQLTYELNKLDRNTKEWKLKAEQLGRVKSEITSVRSKMRGLNTTVKKGKGFISRLADGFNKFGTMAMAAIAGITIAVTGLNQVFKKLSKIIMDFEDSFTDVLTLLNGKQIDKFGNSLEKGAIKTMKKFAKTSKDVNKALFDTISAGISAANAIEVLDAAGIAAISGVTNLSITTDGLTTILNAFKQETKEATRIANGFFTAQKYGKTTVEELSVNVGKVAPIMNMAKLSYQETFAALAELTKNGISTAESTTYLKGMIVALLKPTTEAAKVLRQYNVPIGATEIGAAGLTNTLAALNKMITKNPDVVAKAIPNIRGLTGAMVLAGTSLEDFKIILKEINTDFGYNSSMMEAYTTKTEIMSFQLEQAKAKLSSIIIELKDKLSPIFLTVILLINKISKALRNLTIEFFKTGKEQQDWVIILKEIGNLIKALVTGIIKPFITALKEIFFNTNKNNIITASLVTTLKLLTDIIKAIAIPLAALVKFVTDIVIVLGDFNKATTVLNTNLDNAIKKTDEYGNIIEEDTETLDKYGNKIEYINSMIKENTLLIDENGKIIDSNLPIYDEHGEVLTNISIITDETNGRIKILTPLYDELGDKIRDINPVIKNTAGNLGNASDMLMVTGHYTYTLSDLVQQLKDDFIAVTQEIDNFFNNIDKKIDKMFHPSKYNKIQIPVETKETNFTRQNPNENKKNSGVVNKNEKKATNQTNQTNETDDPYNTNFFCSPTDYTEVENNEAELAAYIRNLRNELLLDEQQRQIAELAIWKENEETKINDWVASQEEKDKAIELLEQQHANKLGEINQKYNRERSKKYIEMSDFLREQELKLHGTRKQLLMAEESNIKDSYDNKIALAEQMARKDIQHAQMWHDQAEALRIQREEAVTQFRLEKEAEFQEKLLNIRKQYDLISDEEKMQLELDKLQELYDDKLISERDFRDAKYNIIQEANNKELENAKKLEAAIREEQAKGFQQNIQMADAVSQFTSELKKKELIDAGDNEEKKKEIMVKYATIELATTVSKIIASTALAVMNALAIPVIGPALAITYGATGVAQIAVATSEYNKVMGMEKGGTIPVVREQDGKNFNATPTSSKGVISKPSILVAENGPEYIVPNEGMENPEIMNFLMMIESSRIAGTLSRFRMPKKTTGYEEGGFTSSQPNIETTNVQNNDSEIAQELAMLRIDFANFKNEITAWQKALYVDYFSFKEADDEITSLETKATIQ